MNVDALIDRMDPDAVFPLVITAMCLAVGLVITIVSVVVCQWRRVRERNMACSLVHEMMAADMSGDQIAKVLEAWSQAGRDEDSIIQLLGIQGLGCFSSSGNKRAKPEKAPV